MPEARAPISIRRRLLVALLVAIAATWLATVVASYVDAHEELDRLLDGHLAQSAALLVAQASHELEELDPESVPDVQRFGQGVTFQIWDAAGALRAHSVRAPRIQVSKGVAGFHDVSVEGAHWRYFAAWNPAHQYLVEVGETHDTRLRIARGVARHLLAPLAIALPVLGLLILGSVTRGLRPLIALGRQVDARSRDNLDPLESADAPEEVLPLVRGINRLFERVSASIAYERRFTADAAHELRTPIAGLRAQAEVARAAVDDSTRRHALSRIIDGCDRAGRLVAQLLALARLEPGQAAARFAPSDLGRIAQSVVADLAPEADAKGVELGMSSEEPVPCVVDADMVAVLVRNLVDNAIRHCPAGTAVDVRVGAGPTPQIAVVDQGPGVREEDVGRLGERFFRAESAAGPGSGLGLSIVRRIADLHGATVRFARGDAGRGLAVVVAFPASGESDGGRTG